MVATKAALSIRVDALTDSDGKSEPTAPSIGIENRAKLESRLRALEHTGDLHGAARFAGNGKSQPRFEMKGETKIYNTQADAVDLVSTQREDPMEIAVKAVLDVKEERRRAKEERRAKKRAEKEKSVTHDAGSDVEMEDAKEVDAKEEKKEKKRKRRESAMNGVEEETQVKVDSTPFYYTFLSLTSLLGGDGGGEKGKKKGAQGRKGKGCCCDRWRFTEEKEEKVGGITHLALVHICYIYFILYSPL